MKVTDVTDANISDANTYRKTATVKAQQLTFHFSVETNEGTMRGNAYDYLCEGIEGERWPVKKEIFEKTYEVIK